MKVGDLLNIDGYGVGTVIEIWFDKDDGLNHASVWFGAEERWIFINDCEGFNESR